MTPAAPISTGTGTIRMEGEQLQETQGFVREAPHTRLTQTLCEPFAPLAFAIVLAMKTGATRVRICAIPAKKWPPCKDVHQALASFGLYTVGRVRRVVIIISQTTGNSR